MSEWIQVLESLISNLGFPIVVCGALFWYIYKTTERHYHEINALKDTLQQNTEILGQLKTLLNLLVKDEIDDKQDKDN